MHTYFNFSILFAAFCVNNLEILKTLIFSVQFFPILKLLELVDYTYDSKN